MTVARIRWVHDGSLYARQPIRLGNAAIGALWALSVLLVVGEVLSWARRRPGRSESDWRDTFDIATRLTLAGVVVASFITIADTWAPAQPNDVAVAACAGARLWNSPYVGITAVPDDIASGVNTREGPGLSFQTNGRFTEQCALGFSAFCVGDPLSDRLAAPVERGTWVNSRWLLLSKDGSWRARALSGERGEDQFVAELLINPIRSYLAVPYRGDHACPSGTKYPQKAELSNVQPDGPIVKLTARAPYAQNMGFAVWKPDGQPFDNAGRYEQIYSGSGSPPDNPGQTDGKGMKTVTWRYTDTVIADLTGVNNDQPPAKAVLMAIPCLAANVPADVDTALTAVFEVSRDGGLHRLESDASSEWPALDKDRFAQAACRART
jgi:hypothetical protein